MVWLSDGENNLKIVLLVSTEYTNVTDKRTDRHRTTAGEILLLASCVCNFVSARLRENGCSYCCETFSRPPVDILPPEIILLGRQGPEYGLVAGLAPWYVTRWS